MRKKPVKSTSVGSDLKRRIVKKQQGGVASYINVNEPVLQYKNDNWIELPDVFSEYNLPTKIKLQNEEPLPIAIKAVDTKEERAKADSERKPVKQNAFINGLRPIIEQTLKRRGLDTKWTDHLVAQAALESGWGKSESGKFNLSGIKGKGSEKNTKEYINGKMVNTRDSFRDYKDYNDWADNYINLLSNKRYGKAWTLSEDQFMPYIINAGYATDPNYISKYNKVLAEVKKYEDGGRIRRFGDGGKTIKEHPETKDIYEFYSKWLSNPEYARRIDKYGFYKSKGKDVARFRQRALDNTTVENVYWDNNYYDSKNDKVVLPTKWNWLTSNVPSHEIGHVLGIGDAKSSLSKPARLSIKEMQKIVESMKGYDPNYEELGIPDENGNLRIPQKEEYGFSSYGPEQYGIPGVLNRLYENPIQWEHNGHIEFYKHSPSEAKANLQSFRYWLYKNGIYNINSGKPFTKDLLDKARQKGGLNAPAKRLLDTFEDDKLINLMNTLASNNQTIGNIQYTKLGGRLIKKRF